MEKRVLSFACLCAAALMAAALLQGCRDEAGWRAVLPQRVDTEARMQLLEDDLGDYLVLAEHAGGTLEEAPFLTRIFADGTVDWSVDLDPDLEAGDTSESLLVAGDGGIATVITACYRDGEVYANRVSRFVDGVLDAEWDNLPGDPYPGFAPVAGRYDSERLVLVGSGTLTGDNAVPHPALLTENAAGEGFDVLELPIDGYLTSAAFTDAGTVLIAGIEGRQDTSEELANTFGFLAEVSPESGVLWIQNSDYLLGSKVGKIAVDASGSIYVFRLPLLDPWSFAGSILAFSEEGIFLSEWSIPWYDYATVRSFTPLDEEGQLLLVGAKGRPFLDTTYPLRATVVKTYFGSFLDSSRERDHEFSLRPSIGTEVLRTRDGNNIVMLGVVAQDDFSQRLFVHQFPADLLTPVPTTQL